MLPQIPVKSYVDCDFINFFFIQYQIFALGSLVYNPELLTITVIQSYSLVKGFCCSAFEFVAFQKFWEIILHNEKHEKKFAGIPGRI